MPKNKLQEVIFTILMVLVMVYAMVCYNIALSNGSMQNWVFVAALHELPLMGALAFVLDFFVVGHLAKKIAMRLVSMEQEHPFHLVLAISAVSVAFMCPLLSLAATIFFQHAGTQLISVWLQTTALNFPMALCWQLFFAGPLVRFVFRQLFRQSAVRTKPSAVQMSAREE